MPIPDGALRTLLVSDRASKEILYDDDSGTSFNKAEAVRDARNTGRTRDATYFIGLLAAHC